MRMRIAAVVLCALASLDPSTGSAQDAGFANCVATLPGGNLAGVPVAARGVAPAKTADICYRSGRTPFFGVRYNQDRRLPDWVAYRVQDTFGADGCGSGSREATACFFTRDNLGKCVADITARPKRDAPPDPFHADAYLTRAKLPRLGITAFAGTGHDRGHLAPNNAFSWHICGAYQTFTMANMAPQMAWLNRHAWKDLEEAELYWGITGGPVYVLTGPIYGKFPSSLFRIVQIGKLDPSRFVQPGTPLKRGGTPIVDPTGFFKVIYKPAAGPAPARAIAFLFPHTTQEGYRFEDFVARIDVVEKAAGLTFAMPDSIKGAGGQTYWLERKVPRNWSVRGSCRGETRPQGWVETMATAKQRVARCVAAGIG